MHLDHRNMLGARVKIASVETLRRLLAYLGATSVPLAEFDDCCRMGLGHRTDHAGTWA
jgi:hypothetical protein